MRYDGPNTRLLYLLQVANSGFPTGAFNHSFGIETMIEEGRIENGNDLYHVCRHWIRYGLAPGDGCGVRLAHAASVSRRDDDVVEIDHLLASIKLPRENREGSRKTGNAFLSICEETFETDGIKRFSQAVNARRCEGHQATAFGVAAADFGLEEAEGVLAFLHSSVSNVVQVAARLMPLGQVAAQRVMTHCWDEIEDGVRIARSRDATSMGASTPALDIASMLHETLPVRLCMS